MSDTIVDEAGNEYFVEYDDQVNALEALVIWKQLAVGRMQCVVQEDNVLFLGNIEIFERPLGHYPLWLYWRRRTAFRRRGLGSAMLEFVVGFGKAKGADAIWGFINKEDLQKTPYLLDWYQRHGFSVRPNTNPSSGAIATIYRQLRVLDHA